MNQTLESQIENILEQSLITDQAFIEETDLIAANQMIRGEDFLMSNSVVVVLKKRFSYCGGVIVSDNVKLD